MFALYYTGGYFSGSPALREIFVEAVAIEQRVRRVSGSAAFG